MVIETSLFIQRLDAARHFALTDRENQIFESRFGLKNGNLKTLEEVGNDFGISRERVRQIIGKSLRKIGSKGRYQLKKNDSSQACAQLISYLSQKIPEDQTSNSILINEFIKDEMPGISYEETAKQLIGMLLSRDMTGASTKKKEILDELFSGVFWPPKVESLSDEEIRKIKTMVFKGRNSYYTGKFFSRKMNREVHYNSLEHLHFLLNLEYQKEIRSYYEFPFKVSYNFEEHVTAIFPQVFYIYNNRKGVVVEIIPISRMALRSEIIRLKALKKFCWEKGYGILVTDGRYSIKQVKEMPVNPEFKREIIEILEKGDMIKEVLYEIKKRHKISTEEFTAFVLQNKITWESTPFIMRK